MGRSETTSSRNDVDFVVARQRRIPGNRARQKMPRRPSVARAGRFLSSLETASPRTRRSNRPHVLRHSPWARAFLRLFLSTVTGATSYAAPRALPGGSARRRRPGRPCGTTPGTGMHSGRQPPPRAQHPCAVFSRPCFCFAPRRTSGHCGRNSFPISPKTFAATPRAGPATRRYR